MMWLNSIKLGTINMHNVVRIYQHYNYIMVEFIGGSVKAIFEGSTEAEARLKHKEYVEWLKSSGRKEFEL